VVWGFGEGGGGQTRSKPGGLTFLYDIINDGFISECQLKYNATIDRAAMISETFLSKLDLTLSVHQSRHWSVN
jgi:hypothetical protein